MEKIKQSKPVKDMLKKMGVDSDNPQRGKKRMNWESYYIFVLDMLKILTAVGFGYFAGRYYELSKSKVHKHTQRGKNE